MSVWKDKDRDHWRFGFLYRGQRHTGRGYKTRREADIAEGKRREEVEREYSQRTLPGTGLFSELCERYLDYSERKHAKQTYQYKVLTFNRFGKYHGDLPADLITPAMVHDFLNTLPSNRVYNAARKEISALFEYSIQKLKLPLRNPCADIEIMPHSPKPKRIPSEEEIIKMLLAAQPGDEQDILLCCLHTMGRIDEVLRMKWEDVNFEKRTITLWTRKRKDGAYEADSLPMNQDLYEVLKDRWRARCQEIWVFYNVDTGTRYNARPKMMASICKRARIEPIGKTKRKIDKGPHKGEYKEANLYYGFHSLRHFMASHLADQERTGLKAISGLLRHKNLKTTEIYLHSIDESQRVAMTGIEGKFTRKNSDSHPALTPTKEKGITNNP